MHKDYKKRILRIYLDVSPHVVANIECVDAPLFVLVWAPWCYRPTGCRHRPCSWAVSTTDGARRCTLWGRALSVSTCLVLVVKRDCSFTLLNKESIQSILVHKFLKRINFIEYSLKTCTVNSRVLPAPRVLHAPWLWEYCITRTWGLKIAILVLYYTTKTPRISRTLL